MVIYRYDKIIQKKRSGFDRLEYIFGVYNMQHIELAEKLGIKKQNINLWIKRKQNIPKKYLPVLEKENAYGVLL